MPITPTNPEPRIPGALSAELRGMYRAPVAVPGDVDSTLMELARGRAAKVRSRRIQPWTLVKWAGVAAAVVAAFIVPTRFSTTGPRSVIVAHGGDVNGDGMVDILDAFALARAARDGDGSIGKADIDAAAAAAVRLTRGGGGA